MIAVYVNNDSRLKHCGDEYSYNTVVLHNDFESVHALATVSHVNIMYSIILT